MPMPDVQHWTPIMTLAVSRKMIDTRVEWNRVVFQKHRLVRLNASILTLEPLKQLYSGNRWHQNGSCGQCRSKLTSASLASPCVSYSQRSYPSQTFLLV